MKAPRFLLGATLLFWGWQTGLPWLGALAALLLESSRWIRARWDFSQGDLDRTWNFCVVLFFGAAAFAFASNDGLNAVGTLVRDSSLAERSEALNKGARSVLLFFQWMPLTFLPIALAQAFGQRDRMDWSTFSWWLRRQRRSSAGAAMGTVAIRDPRSAIRNLPRFPATHASKMGSFSAFNGGANEFQHLLPPHPGPTAVELRGVTPLLLPPLPARNEWGEDRGEGKPSKDGPPLPNPLLPSQGREGETHTKGSLSLLNSIAVHPGPLPQGEGVRPPALGTSWHTRILARWRSILPLPKGEGRGEGKRDFQWPESSATGIGENSEKTASGLNVLWPFFAVCLLAASAANDRTFRFPAGLTLLVGWALWAARPRRVSALNWSACSLLTILLGLAGLQGLLLVRSAVQRFESTLVARFASGRNFDPRESRTMLGEIGRLKLSGRIALRVEADGQPPPELLREVSYTQFKSPHWSATRREFANLVPENDETTWRLLRSKSPKREATIARLFSGGAGLLALPQGAGRLEDLPAFVMETNRLGAVRMSSGPGFARFRAAYGPGPSTDSAPDPEDLDVPPAEQRAIRQVAEELNLKGQRPEERLETVADFFAREFRYSTWLEGDSRRMTEPRPTAAEPRVPRDPVLLPLPARYERGEDRGEGKANKDSPPLPSPLLPSQGREGESQTNSAVSFGNSMASTPLAAFLLKNRAGHCEYFATATTLLLRQAGIPARYAVGYSVQERRGRHWVVRERHAHAWCLAWVNGAWREVDTTPAGWSEIEAARATPWQWISDAWSWIRFAIGEWRWGKGGWKQYLVWLTIPLLLLAGWRLLSRKQWKRTQQAGAKRSAPQLWPGLDSEFYMVERKLVERGLARRPSETLYEWLNRIDLAASTSVSELPLLLKWHYRLRFDPIGLTHQERDALKDAVGRWLSREVGDSSLTGANRENGDSV